MNSFKKQIPNILTTFRLILVPVFWWAFWNPGMVFQGRLFAFAVCFTAGMTDLLDGYLARKFEAISSYGKLIDPLADKLMTISVMICFMITGDIPTLLVAVFLAKDLILVLGSAVLLKDKDIVVFSDIFGKLATVVLALGLALTFFDLTPYNMYLLYAALVIALIAFVRYSTFAVKTLFFSKK
ncbi:MAG: CDP-diacylglycerol--glycerol-3-phosphate 3-phosphatidyltransferase [Clostridiales bacterium]|nr:CDP-diacylglycerol--glycerol-3-phosphate 3-phosphatidyltransferase [Clostridiales bacterium]